MKTKKSKLKLAKLKITKFSNPYALKGMGETDGVKRSKGPLCPTRNVNLQGFNSPLIVFQ